MTDLYVRRDWNHARCSRLVLNGEEATPVDGYLPQGGLRGREGASCTTLDQVASFLTYKV